MKYMLAITAIVSLVIGVRMWLGIAKMHDLTAKNDARSPSNGLVAGVLFVGLSVGFLAEHFFSWEGHTPARQGFANQQTLVILSLIVAISYGLRWFQRTPANETDRYFTQLGAVIAFVSLAVDKQYWSYATFLNATDNPFLATWRSRFGVVELLAILGIYTGLLLMITPWSLRWLGLLWWAPWVAVGSVWGIAFMASGAW